MGRAAGETAVGGGGGGDAGGGGAGAGGGAETAGETPVGGRGRGGGADSITGTFMSTVPPHLAQNLTPGGSAVPHFGQIAPAVGGGAATGGATIGLPQPVQKRESGAFCDPQLEQTAIFLHLRQDLRIVYSITPTELHRMPIVENRGMPERGKPHTRVWAAAEITRTFVGKADSVGKNDMKTVSRMPKFCAQVRRMSNSLIGIPALARGVLSYGPTEDAAYASSTSPGLWRR